MLLFVLSLDQIVLKAQNEQLSEMRRRQLATRLNRGLGLTMQRGTLLLLGRANPDAKKRAERVAEEINKEAQIVDDLVSQDAQSYSAWRDLTKLIRQADKDVADASDYYNRGEIASAAVSFNKVEKRTDKLLKIFDDLSHGDVLAQEKEIKRLETFVRDMRLLLYVSLAASILIAFLLARIFIATTGSKIQKLHANTRLLAAGRAPSFKLSGNDELAAIDASFQSMYMELTSTRAKERAILENANEVICSLEPGLTFTDMNAASIQMWQFDPADLLGRRMIDLVDEADQERVFEKLQQLKVKEGSGNFDARIVRKDGEKADTEWSASYSNEDMLFFCVVRDVTDKRKIERLKQDFFSMVSHDLRTPLTVVQLSHDLIEAERDKLSELASNSLKNSKESVKRLLRLVNNLLDLEKLDSGRVELYCQMTEVQFLIQESFVAVNEIARSKNVELVSKTGGTTECYCDSERVEQVFLNLLSNALKFTPEGSKISVDCQRLKQSGTGKSKSGLNFVKFSIIDAGPGIKPEAAISIFDRFKQGSQLEGTKGFGLGLSICKAIVLAHGGNIGVEAAEPNGSCFWFTLPSTENDCYAARDNSEKFAL